MRVLTCVCHHLLSNVVVGMNPVQVRPWMPAVPYKRVMTEMHEWIKIELQSLEPGMGTGSDVAMAANFISRKPLHRGNLGWGCL